MAQDSCLRMRHQKHRAIQRGTAGVVAERHAEHPERVHYEHRSLATNLVGVEQVLRPVVARHERRAEHPQRKHEAERDNRQQAEGRQHATARHAGVLNASWRPGQDSDGDERHQPQLHRGVGERDANAGEGDQQGADDGKAERWRGHDRGEAVATDRSGEQWREGPPRSKQRQR